MAERLKDNGLDLSFSNTLLIPYFDLGFGFCSVVANGNLIMNMWVKESVIAEGKFDEFEKFQKDFLMKCFSSVPLDKIQIQCAMITMEVCDLEEQSGGSADFTKGSVKRIFGATPLKNIRLGSKGNMVNELYICDITDLIKEEAEIWIRKMQR